MNTEEPEIEQIFKWMWVCDYPDHSAVKRFVMYHKDSAYYAIGRCGTVRDIICSSKLSLVCWRYAKEIE